MPVNAPSDPELDIPMVLWRLGESRVRDVHAALCEQGECAFTTVQTLLRIMADKGIVKQRAYRRIELLLKSKNGKLADKSRWCATLGVAALLFGLSTILGFVQVGYAQNHDIGSGTAASTSDADWSIDGTVTNASGIPLPNAVIQVFEKAMVDGWITNPHTKLVASAKTDQSGAFSIAFGNVFSVETTELVVACHADGYPIAWHHLLASTTKHKVVIQLPEARQSIAGAIVDSESNPIPEAEIRVSALVVGRTDDAPEVYKALVFDTKFPSPLMAISDQAGGFVLDGISEDVKVLGITVFAEGFARAAQIVEIAREVPLRIALEEEDNYRVDVSLVQTDESMRRQNTEVVVASYNRNATGGVDFIGAVSGLSDNSGHITVNAYAGDTASIFVISPDGEPFNLVDRVSMSDVVGEPLKLQLPEDFHTAKQYSSTSDVSCSFSITLPNGDPVKHGVAITSREARHIFENGTVRVSGFKSGETFRLYVRDSSGEYGATGIFTTGSGSADVYSLIVHETATAIVKIRNEEGNPARNTDLGDTGFSVSMALENGHTPLGYAEFGELVVDAVPLDAFSLGNSLHFRTDENGVFAIRNLIPGAEYLITKNDEILVRNNGVPVLQGTEVVPVEARSLGSAAENYLTFRLQDGEEKSLPILQIGRVDLAAQDLYSVTTGRARSLGSEPAVAEATKTLQELRHRLIRATVKIGDEGVPKGSGVVISENGLILTCAHVLQRPGAELTVICDGKSYAARTLGMCPDLDIAMVQIEPQTEEEFEFVEIAPRDLTQGEWCIISGYPGQNTSPLLRLARAIETQPTGVFTTGPVLGGDSGGPVFDLDGRVVGVNSSWKYYASFHASIDLVHRYRSKLEGGEYWRVKK